jgi:hypothetical protein
MAQVYVSYGGKDRGTALPVIEAMNQAGLDVWHFAKSPAVSVGDSFEQTRRELDKAQCVVVLWSKAAAQSDWLQWEIHHAIQAWSSDRLVLAALDETPLPVGLRDLSPIPIREASDSGTKQLIERVQAIVGRSSVAVESRLDDRSERARQEEVLATEAAATAAKAAPKSRDWDALGAAPRDVGRIVAVAVLLAGFAVLAAAILYINSGGGSFSPNLDLPTAESSNLSFVLTILALGVATGAGATACIVWLRRRSKSAPTTMLVHVPAASDGVSIFVSYSRQDGRTVERLVEEMEQLGHKVWIDRESISSQRYAGPIVAAIRDSRFFALMCSQNAFTSDHVIREVYVAGDFKKSFIVFQLDSTKFPDEIHYFLSGFPRLPIAAVDQQQLRSEIARLLAA